MHTKTCYVIKRREMEGKGPKNRVKNRKNGILGGKPTFFFKKCRCGKFGNGESIRNQAGDEILKTQVAATCPKNDH